MQREDRSAVLWYEGAHSAQPGLRDRVRAAEKPRQDTSSLGQDQEPCADQAVRIWLFGRLAASHLPRPLMLRFPHGISARDAIVRIREQLGPDILDDALTLGDCCRVCINGRIVEDLDRPLEMSAEAPDIEMILLIPYDGG